MKRFLAAFFLAALGSIAIGVAPASASFGFKALEATFNNADGSAATEAGSHPFAFNNSFEGNTVTLGGKTLSDGDFKDLRIELPPGFAANPTAVPRCSSADFLVADVERPYGHCPDATALGVIKAHGPGESGGDPGVIYNLVPPPGSVAKLGFHVLGVAVTLLGGVEPNPPYNPFVSLANISDAVAFGGSLATVWGNPADPIHDGERGKCFGKGGSCPVSIPERPFLTLPRSCTGPLVTVFQADSWQSPGVWVSREAETHDNLKPPNPVGNSDCAKVGFGPRVSAQPTNADAESPSGLDVEVEINDEALDSPNGIAQSDMKRTVITLPEGVTANPSLAEGLGVCAPAQFASESVDSEAGGGCPQSSKVGTLEVETPLLEGKTLKGSLFIAQSDDPTTTEPGAENPFDSLIALYMVIKDPELGILVKLPGKVIPDPRTGQLITIFGEPPYEIPQFPLSRVHVHLREGGRSPLVTPPHCGTYTTKAQFTPWANPDGALEATSTFEVEHGVGGGPCPTGGVPPFKPSFSAGSVNDNAGSYSPVSLRITRQDGEQDITKFSSIFPPGLLGKLAGVQKCAPGQIAAAKAKTGRQELAAPSCPAAAKIGRLLTGAGVGSELTYVPGSLYLGGPYHGDPLSVVAIVPAVAGPFDAGTVVVQVALTLNPVSARAEVDGAASDPIPHILQGIVLKVRDIRVYTDRPDFTINPTNCKPSRFEATLFGGNLDVFSSADDVPVSLADRFQAANCASLGFKPKLGIRLSGGTKRGDHPALRGTLTPRPGDANFSNVTVTLPRSSFLDQGHIRTICTRVQFAAHACPPGAVYGHITVSTPLLDEPLSGPVYLRSSNHNLPDLVLALHGIVDLELVARIDSHKGGIRASFEGIPDAPASKAIFDMRGGAKGLIVNSRGLCARPSRATARLTAQNERTDSFSPLVKPGGCGGTKAHKRRR